MKEIVDQKTGAILFKDDESDPLDKKVRILERKVEELTEEIERLKLIFTTVSKDF